jgi:hypothetical protein
VSDPRADTRSDIGQQWIKANVVGAVVNVAVTFIAYLLGQVLDVSDPDTSGVLQAVFVVLATAALTFGLLVLGYLSGVVLRTKLPAFPMASWLALYIITGGVFGAVSAYAWLTPDAPPDSDLAAGDVFISLVIGAAIAGVAISAGFGFLQALILRPVVQDGLGLWIRCCALAGILFVLIVPAVLYGPQSMFGSELAMELVTLVVTILAAYILLPAVKGLVPR